MVSVANAAAAGFSQVRSVRSVRPSEIIKFVGGRMGGVYGTLEKVEEEEVGSIIDSDWASNI